MMAVSNSMDIIVFVDMDAFEVQLHINKLGLQAYRGHPCIVVDDTGRIVSSSHEAKGIGISRKIRKDQAMSLCPSLKVITKSREWNKPDARITRHGSWAVLDCLKSFCSSGTGVVLEYQSSDGFFLNITEEMNKRLSERFRHKIEVAANVYLEQANVTHGNSTIFKNHVGDHVFRLVYASCYLTDLTKHLKDNVNMQCSVGISSNKLLAKIACQLNKPMGITILPAEDFQDVLLRREIDISELNGFGRTQGVFVKDKLTNYYHRRIENLRQLSGISLDILKRMFGLVMGNRLYEGSRGICNVKVIVQNVKKSVSCGKSFHGEECQMPEHEIKFHLENLGGEMKERLIEEKDRHRRFTRSLRIQVDFTAGKHSKNFIIPEYEKPNDDYSGLNNIPDLAFESMKSMDNYNCMIITKLTLLATAWEELSLSDEGSRTAENIPPPNNSTSSPEAMRSVFQLKITLEETDPEIWRTIQVPEEYTFYELHHAIRDAVGWNDWALHEFEIWIGIMEVGDDGGDRNPPLAASIIYVGAPNKFFEGIKLILNYKQTPIRTFLQEVGSNIVYNHGDWRHVIDLEAILPAVAEKAYPCCIAGERAAPPGDEDAFSFKEFLEDLNIDEEDESSPYPGYDPAKFNPEDVIFCEYEVSSDEDE